MDTSVLQFYSTFFTLVVDVMDMLGTLVWERIRMRAEYGDDGTLLRYLPEDFISDDICCEAKETCYNWFCKIGSIHEIVPRIYLELSILRCWRFLDNNFTSILQRLVMMMRGIAKPLASAYCHLYLANSVRFLCSGDDAMGLPSAIDANEGIQLCFFDSRRGQHEGQELDKILFFYPPDCPYSVQLSVIGLSGGMITFTRLFSPDAACEVIEAERHSHVFYQAEPDIWMVLAMPTLKEKMPLMKLEWFFSLMIFLGGTFQLSLYIRPQFK